MSTVFTSDALINRPGTGRSIMLAKEHEGQVWLFINGGDSWLPYRPIKDGEEGQVSRGRLSDRLASLYRLPAF